MINWSKEVPFTAKAIKEQVPAQCGLYQILQSPEYPRYKGITRIVKLGMSEKGLRQELLNHISRHTAANRLARVLGQGEIEVTVRFCLSESGSCRENESLLLRQFEDAHWDLPILNSTRGYERDSDRHYRD
jgi:hypothetical protein